jgi:hypothetical protein
MDFEICGCLGDTWDVMRILVVDMRRRNTTD